jgi:hypothetical protein
MLLFTASPQLRRVPVREGAAEGQLILNHVPLLALGDHVPVVPAHGPEHHPLVAAAIVASQRHQLLLLLHVDGRVDLPSQLAVALDEGQHMLSEQLVLLNQPWN